MDRSSKKKLLTQDKLFILLCNSMTNCFSSPCSKA